MGYRSDWEVIINSTGRGDYIRTKVRQFVAVKPNSLLERMFINPDYEHHNENMVNIGGSSWKLYDWETAISDLKSLFDDDDIEVGYCVIGEDYGDIEVHDTDTIQFHVNRTVENSIYNMKQKTCQCDLHQIMRGDGHDVNCPKR